MIKMVIFEDEQILRHALASIFNSTTNINIVGLAENGQEAISLCEKYKPHIILMDVKMPVCDGIKASKVIKEKSSLTKILIMSSFNEGEYVSKAIKNGADGYIIKNIEPQKLVTAVHNIVNGFSIFQPPAIEKIKIALNSLPQTEDSDSNSSSKINKLTQREIQVFNLIAKGLSNKEIAKELCISVGRVKNIVSTLFLKTNIKDRTQLAIFAVKKSIKM